MLKVEGASWKEQPASAAMRSPGSRAPTGAAEPQWGGKGQQGKYFLRMHPPGLTPAEFLFLSQSTLSAHPTTRSLRLQQANTPHPIPPGVGGLSELGPGAVVPARRSGRVTPASLGVGSSRPRPGLGGAGRRGGREGCVREAGGREASAPGRSSRLVLCGESSRLAAAFFPEPASRNDGEMRGGGTGVALLASVLWVVARCQQRGEPQSPVPLLAGLLRDKALRFAAS